VNTGKVCDAGEHNRFIESVVGESKVPPTARQKLNLIAYGVIFDHTDTFELVNIITNVYGSQQKPINATRVSCFSK
jgi:hypothetical protein